MKKKMFLFAALLIGLGNAQADEVVVNDITIPQGGEATLNIELNNTAEYTRFSLDLVLPDGITVTGQHLGERFSGTDHTVKLGTWPEWYRFIGDTDDSMVIPGTSGTLVIVTLKADEELAVGATYQATLSGYDQATGTEYGMEFTTPSDETILLGKKIFTITIGEPADTRTVLDENSTEAPKASDGAVDIRVKRTITAGNWSTICLPFAMTETQVKDAFGEDVELADFTGCDTEEDDEENTVGITVKFETVSEIEANHPYIIKVSEPITDFTVDDVDINPEAEPSTQCVALRTGSGTKKDPYVYFYDYFTGTYVAETTLPALSLFLNGNKFWYSAGVTKMKAYRAYFSLYFNLTDVEEAYSEVKMSVDGIETHVEGITSETNIDVVYDLSGRKLDKAPQRGVYIHNGKKILK